jgi:hypothetical protein
MDEAIKVQASDAVAIPEPEPRRFQKWKFYADVAKWLINIVGVVIDHIKTNPFPKRNDYATV